jgi:hypothetical protein
MRIFKVISPDNPALAEARAVVWSAIASDPRRTVSIEFKYNGRWYTCRAKLNYGLVFCHRSSGKVVSENLEARLLRFLVTEEF